MTDNNTEKQTLIEPNDSVNDEQTTVEEPKKKSKLLIVVIIICFLLSLCCLAFSFYLYKNTIVANGGYQHKVDALSTQLTTKIEQQNAKLRQSKSSTDKLKTQIEQLNLQLLDEQNKSKLFSADVETLQRKFAEANSRDSSDWILSEVEYLINLSGRKLWLEHDLRSSLALLQAADKRIIAMGDPSLNPLRRALLEDINTLEALPTRDIDGIVLALSGLQGRVDDLNVVGLEMPEVSDKDNKNVSGDVADWETNLNKSWSSFVNNFVVINHRDEPVEALISPDQAWYLKENLRSDLSKAEFAVYREQQDIYDLALKSAMDSVELFYDLEDRNNRQFYSVIKRLSEQKVSVSYPDQFKSAPLLSRILKQRVSKVFAIESAE